MQAICFQNEALEFYEQTTDPSERQELKRVIGGKIVAQHRAGTLTDEDREMLKQKGIRVTLPPNRVKRKPERENKRMPRGVYFN